MRESAVGNEGVGECVVDVPGTGVAHEARLLGEHDEVLVLVADVEVDVGVGGKPTLGDKRLGLLDGGAHAVSHQHLLALGGGGRLVDGDEPRLHELGASRARRHALACGEERVEAGAVGLGTHEQVDDPGARH